MDKTQRIRPTSICLFRNGAKILVSECFDSEKQDYFCRPLGGGIEFGESSQEAMLREISGVAQMKDESREDRNWFVLEIMN